MSKLVSIIIPCFNDVAHIEQAVQSALDQTYEKKEIIVVDDGSNEATKVVLKSLKPRINLLITQQNKGTSAARNAGIAVASGEYILVLDSDDFFEPEFCEKAVKILDEKPEVKLVTCFVRWFWNLQDFQIYKPEGGGVKKFLLSNAAVGNSIFRKLDYLKNGGYDEKMVKGYEDWEFYIRLLKYSGYAYVIPEIQFNYRNKVNSRNKKANEYKYELMEYIYLKHADLYKENFELFTKGLLNKIRIEEQEKIKNTERIEFSIGTKILQPLRYLKNKFN